jgi:hypothetical protein
MLYKALYLVRRLDDDFHMTIIFLTYPFQKYDVGYEKKLRNGKCNSKFQKEEQMKERLSIWDLGARLV